MTDLSNYADFYIWADEKIRGEIEKIDYDNYNKVIDGTKRSIKDLVLHIIAMYDFFFAFQTGISYDQAIKNAGELARSELMSYWENITLKFSNAIKTNEKKIYKLPIGPGKLAEIEALDWFLLFTDHSSYHSGQLMTFLKISGSEGSATDYLKFIFSKLTV